MAEQFDPVAAEYDFEASLHPNYDFVLSHLPPRRCDVLDVGCGSGLLALELSRWFANVVGVDISPEMLAIARSSRNAENITYLLLDAHRLRLDRTFDLIVSRTTFHHLEDVQSVLRTLKTMLRPGGRIVIVDNCSEVPTPARWVYIVGAVHDLVPDWLRYGYRTAIRLFRFRTSKPWLDHLAADRYLSAAGFRQVYGDALPGCAFTRLGPFMGVVWEKPAG